VAGPISVVVQCPSMSNVDHIGVESLHRYIHPVDIAFFAHSLFDDDVASIPDKDEVTSSILVSPTICLLL